MTAVFFIPGGLAGGAVGRLVIRPVNAVLGWLFREFNHYFDRMSSGYAFSVGGLLRVSLVVLAGLWRSARPDLLGRFKRRRPDSFRSRTKAG